MKKLAIITTHPIQYNAPIFKLLNQRRKIIVKVFYTWENSKDGVFDKKFNQSIKWDIPLLEGYDYQFVKNTSNDQGSHHRKGIINPTLIKEIENWQANAILVFGWNFVSHHKAMRYFKGRIPVLFRGDSTLLNEQGGFKSKLRRIVLKQVYKKIDYALYVGVNNKNYYLKHGVKDKQLIFAPHAIDNDRFFDHDGIYQEKANKWKLELGIKKEDIVFLYAGKFEAVKNLNFVITAINELSTANYKFIFAGDGTLKKELQELGKENSSIMFLPFQNQQTMPVLYRLADVFLLPSKSETWGLSVNEAMASNCAVLCSDKVGCAVDLIDKNGFIFKSSDKDDFLNKIKSYNKNNIEVQKQYSQTLIKNFNFVRICEMTEQVVNK